MARKLGNSQPRVKVCEDAVLLPCGNSKGRASFCAAAYRDACISTWITRKAWSEIGDAVNSTRNHEINSLELEGSPPTGLEGVGLAWPQPCLYAASGTWLGWGGPPTEARDLKWLLCGRGILVFDGCVKGMRIR